MKRGAHKELISWIGLALVFYIFVCLLQYFTVRMGLEVEMRPDTSGDFKVYWRKTGETYTEQKSWRVALAADEPASITAELPPVHHYDYLRIDWLNKPATIELTRAEIRLRAKVQQSLIDKQQADLWQNTRQISFVQQDNGILVQTLGNDPSVELKLTPDYGALLRLKEVGLLIGVFCVAAYMAANQFMLHGSQLGGALQIRLPKRTLLRTPQGFDAAAYRWSGSRYADWDDYRVYSFYFRRILPESALRLSHDFQQANPEGEVQFQFNRSGETF